MINTQKLSYKLYLKEVPISKNLRKIIDLKKLSKINYISNGDDYQILFTASKNKYGIIKKIFSKLRIKVSKIGIIQSIDKNSTVINDKNKIITIKNKGYFHQF
jgi:thiamine-monophosphate kinase